MDERTLRMGEYWVAEEPTVLVCTALGSCLSIAIYSPDGRMGGMAHVMLPMSRGTEIVSKPGKYVDTAVGTILSELEALGAERTKLIAKLAGGARMFSYPMPSEVETIGMRNVRAAREVLKGSRVPIIAEEIGGDHGRTVAFESWSGRLEIRTVRHGTRKV